MTEAAIVAQLAALTEAVKTMATLTGSRLTRAQMMQRLQVSTNTLTAGVRTGRYPSPANDGKWLLAEVLEWEQNKLANGK